MRVWLILAVLVAGCTSSTSDPAVEEPLSDGAAPVPDAPPPSPRDKARARLNVTEVSHEYVGTMPGPFALNTGCDDLFDPGGPTYGGICMQLPPGTVEVLFTMKDDTAPRVGAYVRGESGAYGFFCDAGGIDPGGERWLMFIMQDTGACALGGVPGAATAGTIEATIYHK